MSILFNIVLDFVMRRFELAEDVVEWSAGRRLKHFAFADYKCFLVDDLEVLSRETQPVVCETASNR